MFSYRHYEKITFDKNTVWLKLRVFSYPSKLSKNGEFRNRNLIFLSVTRDVFCYADTFCCAYLLGIVGINASGKFDSGLFSKFSRFY
jgi:hypothetical protein